jgi:hypothetical protein
MGQGLRDFYQTIQVALTPASVNANTGAEQTFTVKGLLPGDTVMEVSKTASQAGLIIGQSRVTAADTLSIQFANCTAASIVPTAGETYTMLVLRPEKITFGSRFNPT